MKSKSWKKSVILKTVAIVSLFCFFALFSVTAFSATDTAFEQSISAFPESYKESLRKLHSLYPEWKFVPFETGLDWNTVIDNEIGDKSLVENSVASNELKSKEVGDYNYTTGAYIQKDGGFVTANRMAVEYFMDPRNFLCEENIFQFEDLTFDSAITQAHVEAVLSGTFMANANMNYYDSKGNYIEYDRKYSSLIYAAGKKYNINPCFLASKIKNEIGSNGSASSSGLHSTYPGIYNFYNIGAYDGANAISKGLKWASEGSTYGRPWTSPYKSILGGAQYIAENYVNIGQYTGYLQRFNVNPDCKYKLYEHQYMTNLTGALTQGYTTYLSYVKGNSLYRDIVFSIPVYKNMPSEKSVVADRGMNNADSLEQKATVSNDYSYIRTGPSTDNARLLDSNNSQIKLLKGHSLTVLGKYKTDTTNYVNILQFPYWFKVQFTYNSKTYTGYLPEKYTELSTTTKVGLGTYDLSYIRDSSESFNIVSLNPTVAKVVSPTQVEFLKEGTVYLLTYDSTGKYDKVKYVVSSTGTKTGSLSKENTPDSIKLTLAKNSDAVKYQFTLCDTSGKVVSKTTTTKNTYTFSDLSALTRYYCFARPVFSTEGGSVYGGAKQLTFMTLPKAITSVKAENTPTGATVTWAKLKGATGYLVYGYNSQTNKYTRLAKTSETTADISLDDLIYDGYAVRAYIKDSIGTEYGLYSDLIYISNLPSVPENLGVENLTSKSYTITWDTVSEAQGYQIYKLNEATGEFELYGQTAVNCFAVGSLTAGEKVTYKICSYKKINSVLACSDFTEQFEITTIPDTMTKVVSANETDTTADFSWGEVVGAELYRVYLLQGEEKLLMAETENTKLTIENLMPFTKYTFSVVPCVNNFDIIYEGTKAVNDDVRTKITAVQNFKVDSKGANYINLSWSGNPVATKYSVYFYDSKKGSYKLVGDTAETSYSIENLTVGSSYTVCVRITAIAKDNGKTYTSPFSEKLTVKTAVPVPTGFGSSSATSSSYKISWDAVENAVSYNVYQKKGSSYTKIASTKTNSYDVKDLSAGKKNYYKVTTVIKIGSTSYESSQSKGFSAATLPSKVSSITVTPSATSAKISWKATPGATRYRVYVYSDSKGEYVSKATTEGTSCTVKSLIAGKNYKFAVRAYIDVTGSYVYGSLGTATAMTLPCTVSSVSVSSVKTTSHTLKWSKASKANYYYIYRYSSSAYKLIGETSKTSFSVTGLSSGKTYKYKIVSAILSNGKCVAKGAESAVYKFTTLPAKVSSLKGTSTSSSITLSWGKVTGATGYEIYYYDSDAGAYFVAGTVDTNSFTIKKLSSGLTYKFKVKAIREVSGTVYKGTASSAVSVKTK